MKKIIIMTFIIAVFLLSTTPVKSGICNQPGPTDNDGFGHLCNLLASAKTGDLSFCLGYIKNSKDSNHEIANFILTWSPDAYRKQIPSVFRSKIDRVVKILGMMDYEQLIIDIDFVKNSQLTVDEMTRLIKGTRLYKKD